MDRARFFQLLPAHARDFCLRMDALMAREDVVVRYKANSLSYFPDTGLKLQPLVLRYTVKDGEVAVEMKLNFIDCYTDIIEPMPERVKAMFRQIKHCGPTQPGCDRTWDGGNTHCGTRRTYTLDGIHYYLCSWRYYFAPDLTCPGDADHYAQIIRAEVRMAKARKKHNTRYYDGPPMSQGEETKAKEPLTRDTVIGSRKIKAAEFRRYFRIALGEDYERHPLARDVIKMSANHKGKTLGDIIEACKGGRAMTEELLLFEDRDAMRAWLAENPQGEGVWLIFGKKGGPRTVSAAHALEEALCFGWIDGQMQSIDETRYRKYFAPRRAKSQWSEKNRKLVARLEAEGKMTEHGRRQVEAAKQNGLWESPPRVTVTEEAVAALDEKLRPHAAAHENFTRMSPSVQRTYTGWSLDVRSQEAAARRFAQLVQRLELNLKPMEPMPKEAQAQEGG